MKKVLLFTFILIAFASLVYAADIPDVPYSVQSIEEYNKSIPWNQATIKEFAKNVTVNLEFFYEKVNSSVDFMMSLAFWFLIILGSIDLVWPVVFGDQSKLGSLNYFGFYAPKIAKLAIIAAIIGHYRGFINDILIGFTQTVSGAWTGDYELAMANMTQPQLIVQKCLEIVAPGLNYSAEHSSVTSAFVFIATMWILFQFILLAIQVSMIYIQFYLCALFNIITLPFWLTKWRFLRETAENFSGGLISSMFALILMTVFMHLGFIMMKSYDVAKLFADEKTLSTGILFTYAAITGGLYGIRNLIRKVPPMIVRELHGTINL